MRKFNIIKKSRKKSEGIDEKIEYLDKECQKTGLQEVMTTSNVYQGSTKVPNQDYSAFQALNVNGHGLALSGADGNSIGGASVEDHLGVNGVALSPPHPVTGVRTQAVHVRDGLGGTEPLRPGQITFRGFGDNPPPYTMGSAMWFYEPTYNNGEGVPPGKWCNLEYGNFENNSGWGFWDTIKTGQFAGYYTFNRNTSEHPCAGDGLADKIASINFGTNGNLGAPQTTVLTKNDLGDPTFLPIDIPGLSGEAFNYLNEKSKKEEIELAGANYDMYNWILKTYGMPAAEWYLKTGKTQGNPFVPYGSYFPRASNPYTGAQDGDMFAFFGGNKNNNKNETPEKSTKKTRKGATDATAASTGMYPNMTPEIFQQKYGMTWQEYMNLP